MSGVVKAIGKVFKKVGKVLKKVAPYAIIAAAAIFAAPLIAGALPAAAGAAGAAGAVGAGGAVAGSAVATTGIGGFLSSIGLGSGGALGSLLSSSAFGSALSGAATAVGQKMLMDDREDVLIDRENRASDRLKVDDASLFNFSGTPQGLGVRTQDLTDPTAVVQNTALGRPPRQSAVELAQVNPQKRRYQYNRETGVIDFA